MGGGGWEGGGGNWDEPPSSHSPFKLELVPENWDVTRSSHSPPNWEPSHSWGLSTGSKESGFWLSRLLLLTWNSNGLDNRALTKRTWTYFFIWIQFQILTREELTGLEGSSRARKFGEKLIGLEGWNPEGEKPEGSSKDTMLSLCGLTSSS